MAQAPKISRPKPAPDRPYRGMGSVTIPLDDAPKLTRPKTPKSVPSRPTPAERATSLRNYTPSAEEGRIIDSANRSEGGGKAKGGKVQKMAKGGSFRASANGIAKKGKTKAAMPKMCSGGKMKGYAKGGSIDGIAKKGKTKGKVC